MAQPKDPTEMLGRIIEAYEAFTNAEIDLIQRPWEIEPFRATLAARIDEAKKLVRIAQRRS